MGGVASEIIAGGTTSGWTLCLIAIISFATYLIKQRPKMRELDIGEDSSIRTFLSSEISGLRTEIKDLRDENTALRAEIRELHGVIDGMRREALQGGLSAQRAVVQALPRGVVPESTLAALDRIPATDSGGEAA